MKTKKPASPSQRQLIKLKLEDLRKKPILKAKIKGLKTSSGRNNSGKITVRHKGGGHKQKYRKICFDRANTSTGITCTIEYDPNRNANIASIYDVSDGSFFYILAPKDLKIGDIVKSGPNAEPVLGHSLPVRKIPVGSYIHNISIKTTKPGQISRSAGTYSKLMEKTLEYARIELSSGEQKFISSKCYATIGIVSNDLMFLTQLGKAGQSRWLNRRPTVRGVAMNPVDHPHGGGEGKKSGRGKTPWGKPVKKSPINKKKRVVKRNSNV